MLRVQMAQHPHDISRNMNARTHSLERPSLFINPCLEAFALQQSGYSGTSESGSDDRDTGFALHDALSFVMNAERLMPSFAYRALRNIRSGSGGSIHLDASELDHFGPFFGIRADERTKFGW